MMGGKKPITILTDQARSMEKSIEVVYPDSTHRWCKWHVLKKAKENLGSHYTKKSDFRAEFHKLVHEMLTVDEFEDGWAALLEKYSLKNNPYLTQIYETRRKWAKPYFAGKFCARQTNTGRSESANHMLKQYVPPSCSMNLFVKQYSKLQFDREQEEGFQEKRTRLSGAVFKVMIVLRLKEIPPRHILKRWSVHGRDNLPAHLKHYQQDMGPPDAPTFRHSALYVTALEVANMGDRNPEAFEFMMSGLLELRTRGAAVCAQKDGLGVVEQQVSNNGGAVVSRPRLRDGKATCSVRSVEGNRSKSRDAVSVSVCPPVSQASEGSCANGASYNSDYSETASRLMINGEQDLFPPERNNKRGRPTSSRDKAPYEKESSKRSRFCSICRGKGHKSSKCPDRGDAPKKERKLATCGKCGVPGHRRTTCSKPLLSMMAGVPSLH